MIALLSIVCLACFGFAFLAWIDDQTAEDAMTPQQLYEQVLMTTMVLLTAVWIFGLLWLFGWLVRAW